jgi:hypothetical protein
VRESKHSPARLWAAITRADEVSAWMDYPVKVDLRVERESNVDFGRTGEGELPASSCGSSRRRCSPRCGGSPSASGRSCPPRKAFFDRLDLHLDGLHIGEPEQKARWRALKPSYKAMVDAARSG